ncbi:MAG: hypothetical protein H8D23_08485 [Candidatus Brocadiales bacterium]|nr:hypothetical protein [Candidatus Brocadiales bacterium]
MKPEENTIPESTFKTFFTKHNNFHTYGFKEWIFYPGMLFQDMEAWWTDNGLRPTPHEGIDLCFYRDNTGQVRRIDIGTKIPVMYAGDIVHIHDDFLGKSIYVKHCINDKSGNSLHTIYGHTNPRNLQDTKKRVCEGDIIAEVAAISEDSKVLPHIHITMAWIPESLPCKKLNWDTIWNSRSVTLCNPLEYIDTKLDVP